MDQDSDRQGSDRATVFEIRVRGPVTPAVLTSLGDAVIAAGHQEGSDQAVLVSPVTDEAELRGVVERLLEVGLDILELRPAQATETSSREGG